MAFCRFFSFFVVVCIGCGGDNPSGGDSSLPVAPINLRIVGVSVGPTHNTIVMRWDYPADSGPPISRYELRAYRGSLVCDGNPRTRVSEDSVEEVADLSPGTAYSFHVRANNARGWGPYSRCVFVRVDE